MSRARTGVAVAAVALLVVGALAPVAVGADDGGADGTVPGRPEGLVFVDVSVSPDDPTPERNFTVTASVRNSDDSGEPFVVRDVDVLNGTDGDADALNATDVDRRVAPGEGTTVGVSVGLDDPGTRELGVRFVVESTTGARASVVRPLSVDVRRPHPGLSVRTAETLPGSPANVTVTVSNGMTRPARSLELTLRGENVSLDDPRRVVPNVPAGAERRFTFVAHGNTSGPETFDARLSYVAGNGSRYERVRHLDTRFTAPTSPGAVNLTGLDVTREGDRLAIRGTASNVGQTAASSVLVSVGRGEFVRPGRSTADYFVGRVPASEYTSFEVNARLTDNVSAATVPLRVSYLVDGVRHERVVTVDYRAAATDADADGDGAAPLSGAPVALVGGVAAVAVAGVVGWRWTRGDD